ncbi:serine-rich 25 kDa antigen protein-like isoform X2 [Heptranchias perlo]|uniref:serine-rich 25 kDa antigen protein-like isoform X2 n=1 Tax=Heptranchias perlo TaxID=212740 RepID=UPI003559AFA3
MGYIKTGVSHSPDSSPSPMTCPCVLHSCTLPCFCPFITDPETSTSQGPEEQTTRESAESPSSIPAGSPDSDPETSTSQGPEEQTTLESAESPSSIPAGSADSDPETSTSQGREEQTTRESAESPSSIPAGSPDSDPETSTSQGPEEQTTRESAESPSSIPAGSPDSDSGRKTSPRAEDQSTSDRHLNQSEKDHFRPGALVLSDEACEQVSAEVQVMYFGKTKLDTPEKKEAHLHQIQEMLKDHLPCKRYTLKVNGEEEDVNGKK